MDIVIVVYHWVRGRARYISRRVRLVGDFVLKRRWSVLVEDLTMACLS